MTLRLLTLGHSYGVAMNRRLADAFAREGGDDWSVTVAAPEWVATDRGVGALEPLDDERARLVSVPVRMPGRIHWMTYGGALRRLLDDRWDVVHCWEEPFVAAAWQVARWTPARARLVFATFQNLPKRYPPPFSWGERRALSRAAGWIAFGKTVEEVLTRRADYAALPHRRIPPPVDTGSFRPDPAARERVHAGLGWSGDAPVVGYVGRLVREKGLGVLTAALDRLDRWRALIVGDGPMRAELERWAARHPERVRLVHGAGHDRVPELMAGMDLLCLPSLSTPRWREQFGRVLIEGMAAGLVVVGSDSGEIPHVIGDAGVVAPEGDVERWADALESLLLDPARRAALSDRGRARVEAEFALPVVARRHLEFFASLARGA